MVSYKELFGFLLKRLRLQKGFFAAIFLLDSLAWPLDALIWPYILQLAIDVFIGFEQNRAAAWEALKTPIYAGIGMVFFTEIASRTMGFLMAKAIPRLQEGLRFTLFDHIQRHSPRYFNERFSGALANQITDMTTQTEAVLQQLFWPIIPALSACFLGAAILWFIHPLFTIILLSWIAVHLFVCFYFTRSCDAAEHKHGQARSALLGKIVDSLTNNFAVNLFYRFSFEKRALAPFQKQETETNIYARRAIEKMRTILSFFYFLGAILGMNGALLYLWVHGQMTTGQAIQVFTTLWNLTIILWNVGNSLPVLFQSFGTLKQAYSVMKDPEDLNDIPNAPPLNVAKGEIVFDSVAFQYGEKKLFENKHVRIHGHQKVGLVGFTGAGKSTFINLILRFFPVQKGKIAIDGQDIARISLESLRSQIALIPQDPILFHRSLRENIAFGNPAASASQIIEAAKLAHCHDFIRHLPQGYDSVVGERGTKLSGGEKQRIAIARAILRDAPILILDEATSSLDSVTETCIQDSLHTLMQNRTTLVIAHRLSTLSRMDRILVFDQGRIVEDGPHASLLSQNGLYAQMWNMQVGGFLPENPNRSS